MVPFYMAVLPKMGFNRHLPLEIRYGPKRYNGKGLAHLYTYQFIFHLERFIGTLRSKDNLGKLLRLQMDKHQMHLGTSQHFLQLNSNDYPYGEKSRIQFLWEECSRHNIQLHISGAWVERPARVGDVFLMDRIAPLYKDKAKLERINAVRLYLQGFKTQRYRQPRRQ